MDNIKRNYDFWLTIASVFVLFLIAILCTASMFYFKWAQIQNLPAELKVQYEYHMNELASPLLIALLVLLGLCIPKRILNFKALIGFSFAVLLGAAIVWIIYDWRAALLVVLSSAILVQTVVFWLTLIGKKLHFRHEGYLKRLGSCFIHLGLLLICLDILLLSPLGFLKVLFWTSSFMVIIGLVLCFYADILIPKAIKNMR